MTSLEKQRTAELVRHLRGGKSQRSFANQVRVGHKSIGRWEDPANPASLGEYGKAKLCEYLGTSRTRLQEYLAGGLALEEFLATANQPPESLTLASARKWFSTLQVGDLMQLLQDLIQAILSKMAQPHHHRTTIAELVRGWGDLEELAEASCLDKEVLEEIAQGTPPSDSDLVDLATVLTKPNGDRYSTHELMDIRDHCNHREPTKSEV